LRRPVKARARRTAAEVTSAPVLEKRTFSAQGTSRFTCSATSTSSGCMSEKVMPSCSCSTMARSTSSSQ
jgi:hypothetical protein